MFIFIACGSPATKSNSSKKLNEIDTQKNENKDENISENKIVWVLPEEFIKITKLQDNTVYLNQQRNLLIPESLKLLKLFVTE